MNHILVQSNVDELLTTVGLTWTGWGKCHDSEAFACVGL